MFLDDKCSKLKENQAVYYQLGNLWSKLLMKKYPISMNTEFLTLVPYIYLNQ